MCSKAKYFHLFAVIAKLTYLGINIANIIYPMN